ncbi:MAG: DUF4349 domain-containing protein, partial [Deltaproteobacteria bacterium]
DDQVRSRIALREIQGEEEMNKTATGWLRPQLVPSGVFVGILGFLIVGTLATQIFTKRGYQGREKAAADDMGEQYSPGKYSREFKTDQYEPYYQDSKASVSSARSSQEMARGEAARKRIALNNNPVHAVTGGAVMQGPLTVPVPPPDQGSVIVIQPTLPAVKDGDMVIRTALIDLEVIDGQKAYDTASKVCREMGGYLAASHFFRDAASGRQAGKIVMRIPKANFLDALTQLSSIGKVENKTSDSRDVTQEYLNVKAQLDAAMVVYNKVLDSLQKRQTSIPEAMRLESEITPILARVQSLKNRLDSLDNQIALAMVTVQFHEADVSAKVLADTKNELKKGMLAALIDLIRWVTGNLAALALTLIAFISSITAVLVWVLFRIKRKQAGD